MNNNFTETGKTHDNNVTPEIITQSSIPSDDALQFQIFFLAQDQSQNVEVVETGEIDFGEVIQRLKIGESVFIKYKNQKTVESPSTANKKKELW